jgi:hypothetical protein
MRYLSLKKTAFLIIFLTSQNLLAKIGDPPPVTNGTKTFRSHENYIEAIDSTSKQVLWKTLLYKRWKPIIKNPLIEEDVQWNIITSIKLDGSTLIAVNKVGSMYFLDPNTGQQTRKPIIKVQWTKIIVVSALLSIGLFFVLMIKRN